MTDGPIKLSFTPGTDDSESLALMFDEARRADELVIASVEGFNTRAAAVLGLVAGVLAVVSAADIRDETRVVQWLLGAAIVVLIVAGAVAAKAWMVRDYRADPKLSEESVNRFLQMDPDVIRMQILVNRLDGVETNSQLLKKKRRDFLLASFVALVAVALFVSVFFIRLFDAEPSSCRRHDDRRAVARNTDDDRISSDCGRPGTRGSREE